MKNIQLAEINHLKVIIDIYNQAIPFKKYTADMTSLKLEDRKKWFIQHSANKYPICLYVINKKIVGWISLSAYRPGREALRYIAEVSYYIDFNFHRQGIARELVCFIIKKCPELGIRNLFALVLEKNKISIKFLKKFKFKKWGFLPKVADFNGQECGYVIYGLRLK